MKEIILASTSPRRRDILKKLGLKFISVKPDYEEVIKNSDFSYEKIENLAYNKAKSVADKISDSESIVIGADTVVVLDKTILGKPHTKKRAKDMLHKLSGKEHFVVTSICGINSKTKQKEILSTT